MTIKTKTLKGNETFDNRGYEFFDSFEKGTKAHRYANQIPGWYNKSNVLVIYKPDAVSQHKYFVYAK